MVFSGLGRPGDALLFRGLSRSTIGAEGFHGRVRDGIGWGTLAIATRPAKTGDRPGGIPGVSQGVSRGRFFGCEVFCEVFACVFVGCRAGLPAGPWLAPGGVLAGLRVGPAWSSVEMGCALGMTGRKPNERLVPVGCMRCRTSTSGLSTWWSTTALQGYLVFRGASRLDAFSGYPVHT